MPDKEIQTITFDIMDFIEDDAEALQAFESILEEDVNSNAVINKSDFLILKVKKAEILNTYY